MMKTIALGVAAAPLLVAQGLWVRRVTPVLPEAEGPRTGECAPPGGAPSLRLLILGDSSAAGVGARHQAEALAGRLPAALAARTGTAVRWRLVARTGATARELPALLDEHGPVDFDIALIVVGVNDVTGLRSQRAWLADLDALAARLRAHAPRARLVASGLPPMHRFPALPQPLRAFLGGRATAFDRALARWARGQPDAIHVPIPDMDDPALAASDGFHPGPGAYALWAEALADAMPDGSKP
jgi:lysophospholipase L1-like esterase